MCSSDLIEQLTSLQKLLQETEERTEQVKKAREGIVSTETRITNLSREIDNKFDMLERLTRNEVETSAAESKISYNSSSPLSPKDKETIRSLVRKGWSREEIAHRTGRSIGEVDLLIDMEGLSAN